MAPEQLHVFQATGAAAGRHWPLCNLGQLHQAALISPGSRLASGGHQFWQACCSLAELSSPEFIQNNLRDGVCSLFSTGPADRTDGLALRPDGRLVIRLTRDSFERLGLNGRRCRSDKQFYVVQVELLSSQYSPGKRSFEQLQAARSHRFALLAARTDAQGRPAAIWFPESAQARRLGVEAASRSLGLQRLPEGLSEMGGLPGKELHRQGRKVLDWLGWLSAGAGEPQAEYNQDRWASRRGRPMAGGRYVSALTAMAEGVEEAELHADTITGLLPALPVQQWLEQTRQAVQDGELPWAAFMVWGFEDSVVPCWGLNGHVNGSGRGTQFAVVILPERECIVLQLQ